MKQLMIKKNLTNDEAEKLIKSQGFNSIILISHQVEDGEEVTNLMVA